MIGAHPHVSHAAQPNQCLLTCASLSRGPRINLGLWTQDGVVDFVFAFRSYLTMKLLQALYVFIKTADLRRVADSYRLTAVIIRVKAKNTGYA